MKLDLLSCASKFLLVLSPQDRISFRSVE